MAKIAGVPKKVLEAAENKLAGLESGQFEQEGVLDFGRNGLTEKSGDTQDFAESSKHIKKEDASQGEQLSLFSFAPNPVIERLKSIDLMKLAPWEALKILGELQEAAND